jgi:hypothetical protein
VARPISEETRAAVVRDLRARWGTVSVRSFAAEHDISATTIRKIAGEIGLTAGEAHARTANATEQNRATNAQRRARLAGRFLDEAEAALDAISEGSTIAGFSFGVFVEGTTSKITARDRRELLTAAAIAGDKHKMLDQYDADADTTDVAKFLNALGGAVAKAVGTDA